MDKTATTSSLKEHHPKYDGVDRLGIEDLQRSAELSTDLKELDKSYFWSLQLVGGIASIALSATATYWAFTPPASVLLFINQDIVGFLSTALSDKLGRRWFVIGASLMGLIGGIMASRAQTINTLVGANVFLGLGGGINSSTALTVGEMMPHRYKFVGIAISVIFNCLPYGFGNFLARRLVETASWRWIYYIYLMIAFPVLVLQYFFYKPPSFRALHGPERSRWTEFRRLDFMGIGLMASGLALLILGVSWGGQPYAWTSAKVLAPLIIGGVLLIIFGFWEVYAKIPNRIFPMEALKEFRGFVILTTVNAALSCVAIGLSVVWPQQVAQIYTSANDSWQRQAWLSSTFTFGIWAGIVLFGPIFHLLNVRAQMVFWTAVTTCFAGGLAAANRSNQGQSAAFSFLAGLPVGFIENASGLLVQLDCNDADTGRRFAALSVIRAAFASVMTTTFIAILANKIPVGFQKKLIPALLSAGLPQSSLPAFFTAFESGDSAQLQTVPGFTPTVANAMPSALSDSYAYAYQFVYYALIAIGLVATILACFLKDYNKLLTSHIARTIGNQPKLEKEVPTVMHLEEKAVSHYDAGDGDSSPNQAPLKYS